MAILRVEFWRRRFLGEATPRQRRFDFAFGVLLPLLCVYLDPIVFTRHPVGDSSDEPSMLERYQAVAYVEIALQVSLLAIWTVFSRRLRPLAGIFAGSFFIGAAFSLGIGIVLLRLSLIGILFSAFALPGFAPWVTGFIYARNGVRGLLAAEERRGPWGLGASMFLGAGLALAPPIYLENRMEGWITELEIQSVRQACDRLPLPAPVAFGVEEGVALLAVGWADGTVQIWDVSEDAPVRTVPACEGPVRALALSADGKLAAAAGSGPRIQLLDMAAGKPMGSLAASAGTVTALAFSPDGSRLASGGGAPGVTLWDPLTAARLRAFPLDGREATALAFSTDGRTLACGTVTIDGDGARGEIRLLDPATGVVLRKLDDPWINFPISLTFSPDGRTLAWGALSCGRTRGGHLRIYSEVMVRNLDNEEIASSGLWELARAIPQCRGLSVSYSPDGKTLAVGAANDVCLWKDEKGNWLTLK